MISAKPILGAIGTLGATALTASLQAIICHIAKRNKKHHVSQVSQVSEKLLNPDEVVMPKYKEILENIMKTPSVNPVTNIIGSGLKSF